MPKEKFAEYLDAFIEFLKFKSISTDEQYRQELLSCAKWIADYIKKLGFNDIVYVGKRSGDVKEPFDNNLENRIQVIEANGIAEADLLKHFPTHKQNPVVVGIYEVDKNAPWILVYGHYDVQPAEPHAWDTPPFEPVIKRGKVYARGASDMKGRLFASLIGLKYLIENQDKHKGLKYNIVLVIEGEEEVAGNTVQLAFEYVKQKYGTPKIAYINDVTWFTNQIPSIMYSVRGAVAFELTLKTGELPLHSGLYGNIALNAGNLASYIVFKLKDIIRNRIRIDKLHRLVRKPSAQEIEYLSRISPTWEQAKENAQTYFVTKYNRKGKEFLALHLIGLRPSLDVNGIVSGYTGKGLKMIIPNTATVKFSIRTVPYMTQEKTSKLAQKYIDKLMKRFKGVQYELKILASAPYAFEDINNPILQKTREIMSDLFETPAILVPHGASNLAAGAVKQVFPKTTLLMPGIGKPSHNIHAQNENIEIEMLEKGARLLVEVYRL